MGALCCNAINIEGSSVPDPPTYKFNPNSIGTYISRICLRNTQTSTTQVQKKKFHLYCSQCGIIPTNLHYIYQCNICKTYYCIHHFYTHHKANALRIKPYKPTINCNKRIQINTFCQLNTLFTTPKVIIHIDLSFSELGNQEALLISNGIRRSTTLQGLSAIFI